MPPRPPKKPKPDFAKLNVSRGHIDDPTSAFPIGALNEPESVEGDDVVPLSPAKAPTRPEPAPPPAWVVAGIDLRWLALSLLAGGVLAVFVVALFGVVVLLVR